MNDREISLALRDLPQMILRGLEIIKSVDRELSTIKGVEIRGERARHLFITSNTVGDGVFELQKMLAEIKEFVALKPRSR